MRRTSSCRYAPLVSTMEELEATVVDLKKQLADKSLELEKEIALRKLLNRQKDEQARRLHALQEQLDNLAANRDSGSCGITSTGDEQVLNKLHQVQERNQQLTAQLCHTEAELQSLKLSKARSETASSAKVAAQSAALVEQLSSVQHEREKALTSQLRIALKEKDEAIAKLNQLRHKEEDLERVQNEGFQHLLEDMRGAKGTLQLQSKGDILLDKVRALKEKHKHDISDKIQMLTSERDQALSKAQGLMSDISQLQRQLEMMETEYKLVDKTRVKALQAQLLATTDERDAWQQKAAKFEDTIETLRILSSLQRSLSNEEDIKRKFELELQKCHAEKEALTTQLEQVIQERNHAVVERNHVVQERNSLAIQAQQEYERAERFQRLVLVLRKKARSSSGSGQLSVQNV